MPSQQHTTIEELLPEDVAGTKQGLHQELAVLQGAESADRYRNTPVSVVCPGCGTPVDRFVDGLPQRLAHFKHHCAECETTLYRWCAVVVPTSLEQKPSAKTLETVVTDYFARQTWDGITTSPDEYPRNREYTEVFASKAEDFGWEWELECPLCRQPLGALEAERLDYHHWTHDPDRGVCLCRTCHTALTANETDNQIDWRAQQLGLRNKHDIQIIRLALREQAVAEHGSLSTLARTLQTRYNLHLSAVVVSDIIQQVAADGVLLDIIDGSLFDDLSIELAPVASEQ